MHRPITAIVLAAALAVSLVTLVAAVRLPGDNQGYEPVQPIAYSHKQHIALGLQCLDCHSTADTRAAATIPSVQKCMLCHAKIASTKPEIQKLAVYASSKREVPWQRVYGFPPEALVKFQHGAHFRARIDCGVKMEVHLTLAARDALQLHPGRDVWLVIKTHSCQLVDE